MDLEVDASHAATRGHCRHGLFLLWLLGDHGLGGDEKPGNRGGAL
jgi:hypothetical protein